MFNCNLFSVSCADAGCNMDELPSDIAVLADFLLSEECFCWQTDLLLLLDVANDEDWVGVIASNDFVNMDIVLHQQGPCGVPPHDSFLGVDPTHHVEHLFVVDVVEKPNVRLLGVFLEWNCVAIGNV